MKLSEMMRRGVGVFVHRGTMVAARIGGHDVAVGALRMPTVRRDPFGNVTEADVDVYASWPFGTSDASEEATPTKKRARNASAAG